MRRWRLHDIREGRGQHKRRISAYRGDQRAVTRDLVACCSGSGTTRRNSIKWRMEKIEAEMTAWPRSRKRSELRSYISPSDSRFWEGCLAPLTAKGAADAAAEAAICRLVRQAAGRSARPSSVQQTAEIVLALLSIPLFIYTATSYWYHRAIPAFSLTDLFSGLHVSAVDLASPPISSQQLSPWDVRSAALTYDFTPSIDATQKYGICVRHETPTGTLEQEMRIHGLGNTAARVARRGELRVLKFSRVWALMILGVLKAWQRLEGWLAAVGETVRQGEGEGGSDLLRLA
ncbi:hypothetical protein NX059_007587 [Plenodomus lindquistii]|nr:hypothetical protein NX059_007587 [Plenodomus lindquistii]